MKNLLKVWKQIYRNRKYVVAQVVLMIIGFVLVSYLQNFAQIHSTLGYVLPASSKFVLVQNIILHFYTNNLPITLLVVYSIVILLFSHNILLTHFYFKERSGKIKLGSLSISGIVAALGFGCAACGGVLFTSVLSTIGGAGLILLLPYGGNELLAVAISVLLYGAVSLSNKINAPLVC